MPSRKFQSQPVRFALTKAIVENYAASKKNDLDFAAAFSLETGESVAGTVVANIRKAFGIPANSSPGNNLRDLATWKAEMEKRVGELEGFIETLKRERVEHARTGKH